MPLGATHDSPAPHSLPSPQGWPAVAGTTQVNVSDVHTSVAPHDVRCGQELPATGMAAQVPQGMPGRMAQKPLVHCAGKAQAPPLATPPVGWTHAEGMFV